MDFIKETKKTPHLVKLPKVVKIPEVPNKKFNLNLILLVGFVLFLIFFLYNCKYGCFKIDNDNPVGYSLHYNLS